MNEVWNLDPIYRGFDDPAFDRDMTELKDAVSEFASWTQNLESIEPLGDAYLVYVRIGEQVVVFKHTAEEAPDAKVLKLAPNAAKLHLFDPETEKRINA